jgi:hypothetical protein
MQQGIKHQKIYEPLRKSSGTETLFVKVMGSKHAYNHSDKDHIDFNSEMLSEPEGMIVYSENKPEKNDKNRNAKFHYFNNV